MVIIDYSKCEDCGENINLCQCEEEADIEQTDAQIGSLYWSGKL